MKIFKEIDTVQVLVDVIVDVIRDKTRRIVPSGTEGAVVLVFGAADQPEAYMIEFYLKEIDEFALATLKATDVGPV
jgi:calcineurin-like phosphoesterase family protein